MTWEPTYPYRPLDQRKPAVSVAIVQRPGPSQGSPRTVMSLTVRPDLIEGGLSWWQIGQDLMCEAGTAEHLGQLRVRPGGPYRLSRRGGAKNAPIAAMLTVPREVLAVLRPVVAAEYVIVDTALVVTLPADWLPAARLDAA